MRGRATMWVVAAAMLWGTTGTAQALGDAEGSPLAVGALRMLIGALGLAAISRRRLPRPPLGWWAAAAVAMAGYQVAFFSGVARTGVAVGSVVAIGSAPVVAGMLGWLVRGERPERRWWTATGLAVAGVALIAGRPDLVDPVGVVLMAAAGVGYATYALASKHLLDRMAPEAAMTAVFAAAALLLAPLLAGADLSWASRPEGIAAAVWLGLGATAVAYVAFARGLEQLPVGTATTLSLAEPATATLLGVMLLEERPGLAAWVGVAAVLAAVVVLGRPQKAPTLTA